MTKTIRFGTRVPTRVLTKTPRFGTRVPTRVLTEATRFGTRVRTRARPKQPGLVPGYLPEDKRPKQPGLVPRYLPEYKMTKTTRSVIREPREYYTLQHTFEAVVAIVAAAAAASRRYTHARFRTLPITPPILSPQRTLIILLPAHNFSTGFSARKDTDRGTGKASQGYHLTQTS